jgi:hypothetical protein
MAPTAKEIAASCREAAHAEGTSGLWSRFYADLAVILDPKPRTRRRRKPASKLDRDHDPHAPQPLPAAATTGSGIALPPL